MKPILTMVLTGCMIIFACMGGCAEAVDLSGMSLEQLYALRETIDAQIEALEAEDGAVAYEAGGYLVGRDIPAGDYALIENEDAIFASVSVRSDDSAESVLLAYALINHQAMIHFAEGEWVVVSEATAWPMESAPARGIENGTVHEGAYLVGAQIPEGEYVVFMAEKAPLSSYSVYDDILLNDGELIRFEVIEDDVSIQLQSGDYIELSGCMLSLVKQTQ